MKNEIVELNESEIALVGGGPIFAAAFAPAFIKGAKWGAGLVMAVYGGSKL